jgi:hypothetical protein
MSYAVLEGFVYSLRRDLVSYPIPLSDANEGLVSHWATIPSGAKKVSPLTASIECQR